MTDLTERLDAIQSRLDVATPGPWDTTPSVLPNADQVTRYNADSGFAGFTEIVADNVVANDSGFIASAPSDVAFLLDMARKQRAALAEAWDDAYEKGSDWGEWAAAPVREEPKYSNPYRT